MEYSRAHHYRCDGIRCAFFGVSQLGWIGGPVALFFFAMCESRTGSRAIVQPTEVYDEDDGGQTQALSIGAMAVCRSTEDQLPNTSYNNEQAPSMGFMVGDRMDSQSGGGNFSYGASPSHTDV
ncbi:hypothetical protein L1987_03089 [Smallanthus sonchifolius]|uniref:Uncharacterized protein n=1 Tax=Smallanthus sonchifolius TaxID=185202 RepID=A0ACB9K9J6_9ASTR|nr:hypothetical protein L1987_03089 [Smallanthus sonchifolius]